MRQKYNKLYNKLIKQMLLGNFFQKHLLNLNYKEQKAIEKQVVRNIFDK